MGRRNHFEFIADLKKKKVKKAQVLSFVFANAWLSQEGNKRDWR